MAGVAHVTLSEPTRAGWYWFGEISSRYLLPVLALASLVLGGVLILRPSAPVGPYLPLLLVAMGLGTLAAFPGLRPPGEHRKTRQPTPPPTVSPPALPDSPQPTSVARARPTSFPPARGSEWRVLSAPPAPGDETWLSWLPRESRRLGGGVRAVRPGRGYSPGRAGSLVALPLREQEADLPPDSVPGAFAGSARGHGSLRIPEGRTGPGPRRALSDEGPPDPPRRLSRRRAFSEEELDRMFPPAEAVGRVFLADVPEKIGLPSAPSRRGVVAEPQASGRRHEPEAPGLFRAATEPVRAVRAHGWAEDSGPGTTRQEPAPSDLGEQSQAVTDGDSRSSKLRREAVNPVPPHLRDGGFAGSNGAPGTVRNRADASPAKSVCASCSKVVVNLRMSGPCPKCLRPICNDCLREALAGTGHGWCIDCAAELSLAAA
jgi:hypothetical protein